MISRMLKLKSPFYSIVPWIPPARTPHWHYFTPRHILLLGTLLLSWNIYEESGINAYIHRSFQLNCITRKVEKTIICRFSFFLYVLFNEYVLVKEVIWLCVTMTLCNMAKNFRRYTLHLRKILYLWLWCEIDNLNIY